MSTSSCPSSPVSSSTTPSTRHPRTGLDLLSVVTAGLLWGTGGLSGALLGQLTGLQPLAVATYRLAGGGLTLVVVLACTGRLRFPGGLLTGRFVSGRPVLGRPVLGRSVLGRSGPGRTGTRPRPNRSVPARSGPSRAALRRVLAVGLLSALYQACYFAAVSMTDLAVATLIPLGLAPVLVLGVEAARRRSVPAPASLVAIALAVLGLVLLVGVPGPGAGGARMAAGVALAVITAAAFAALALLGARPVDGLDAAATIGWGFTTGGVLLAALAGPTVGLAFAPTAASLGLLAYLAWVPTALAYGLFFLGLRGVAASSAAVIAVLEPVTASVLGVLVLGQRMGLGGVLGAALLCVAVVVAGLGGRRAGGSFGAAG